MKSLRRFISLATQRSFVRNVAAVASGTALAQGITIAFAPIVTRIYGPEAFGIQGTFLSLVAIITPLSSLAYPIAIVLPKLDSDAQSLKLLSMMVSIGIAIFLFLGLLLSFDRLVKPLGYDSIAPYLWLLPLVTIISAWQQVTQQWLFRNEGFKALSGIAVIQAILVNVSRIGLGLLSATAAMLIAVTTLGLGIHAAMQWWSGRHYARQKTSNYSSRQAIRLQAVKYRDFPLFRAPEMIINAVSESLPILALASAFGPAEAGFYTLARSVLYLPLNLIGQSVANVFYPHLNAEALAGRPLLPLLKKTWAGLAAIGLPLFIIIAIGSPWIFSFAFGADWKRSGLYASLLCPWLLLLLVNRPCVGAISVLRIQKLQLLNTLVFIIARASSLIIGVTVFQSPITTIALFSATGAASGISIILIVAFATKSRRNYE